MSARRGAAVSALLADSWKETGLGGPRRCCHGFKKLLESECRTGMWADAQALLLLLQHVVGAAGAGPSLTPLLLTAPNLTCRWCANTPGNPCICLYDVVCPAEHNVARCRHLTSVPAFQAPGPSDGLTTSCQTEAGAKFAASATNAPQAVPSWIKPRERLIALKLCWPCSPSERPCCCSIWNAPLWLTYATRRGACTQSFKIV